MPVIAPVSPIVASLAWSSSLSINGVLQLLNPLGSGIDVYLWEEVLECAYGPLRVRVTDSPYAIPTGGSFTTWTAVPQRLDERDTTPILALLRGDNGAAVTPYLEDAAEWNYYPGAGSGPPYQPTEVRGRTGYGWPRIIREGYAWECLLPGSGGVSGRAVQLEWDELAPR